MDSRSSKYNSDKIEKYSRVENNQELYSNITKNSLDNFNVMNNATVLGENRKNQIDVNQIKKILDTKYSETSKRKSIRLDDEVDEDNYKTKEIDITREYDINAILNKAREENNVSYEEERIKKLRDTQFDILNNLNVDKKSEEEEVSTPQSNLMNLINTININENKGKYEKEELEDSNSDLFSDLISSGKTEAVGPIPEEKVVNSIEEVKSDNASKVESAFYTTSSKFNKKDFEDLGIDEKGDRNIITEVIVVIILLAFIAGMFFFFKSVLNF